MLPRPAISLETVSFVDSGDQYGRRGLVAPPEASRGKRAAQKRDSLFSELLLKLRFGHCSRVIRLLTRQELQGSRQVRELVLPNPGLPPH